MSMHAPPILRPYHLTMYQTGVDSLTAVNNWGDVWSLGDKARARYHILESYWINSDFQLLSPIYVLIILYNLCVFCCNYLHFVFVLNIFGTCFVLGKHNDLKIKMQITAVVIKCKIACALIFILTVSCIYLHYTDNCHLPFLMWKSYVPLG